MARIQTFKTKILLLVLAVLVTATTSLVILSKWEIESGLYSAEQEAARDVVYLLAQTIDDQYQDLIDHQRSILDMRKGDMKDLSALVVSIIDGYYKLFGKGLLTESEAKRQAIEHVRAIRYGREDYFFVYDKNYTAISHPDPLFMGKQLKDYRDAKGLLVIQALMRKSQERGGGFVSYWWKRLDENEPVRKLGYAIFYPKWQWMIGTGLYIDDLDEEYQRKLSSIIEQLKINFSRIRKTSGASLFLFDGNENLLIPPSGKADEKPPLGRLMAAALTPDQPLRYFGRAAASSPKGEWRQAYVAHFQPLNWYIVGAFNESELEKPGNVLIEKAAIFLLIAAMLGLGLAYVIAARVTRPLSQLAQYAQELPSQDFVPETDLAVEDLSGRGDEIGRLAQAFLFMQKMLQRYLDHLKETTAAKERMESELNIAHDIQMSMVPKTFPPFPDHEEFGIYATLIPAREVGGDLYDFFFIDENRLCFAIGDVAGKGIPASLFMALTKTMFRATGGRRDSTATSILSYLNTEISRDNDSCMFVTLFCGILDVRSGQLEYSNAGHNSPYHLSSGLVTPLTQTGGVALGALESATYQPGRLLMKRGDHLVLYTDGVTEAMDSNDTLFSEKRLKSTLQGMDGQTSEQITNRVVDEVQRFAADAPQSDDITLLVLSYLGATEDDGDTLALQLINDLSQLQVLQESVTAFANDHAFPEEFVHRVNLALEEAITNIIAHGYDDSSEHKISVRLSWQDPKIKIEIEDDGRPFNPLEAPAPIIDEPAAEREIGGLGIHLVKKMMDEMEYRRAGNKNLLVLKAQIRGTK